MPGIGFASLGIANAIDLFVTPVEGLTREPRDRLC
jgi:hypothetical protein